MGSTRLSGADAAWLHMDRPANLMIVNTVVCLDGPIDWRMIEDSFFERVVGRFAVFSSRVVDPPMTLGLIGPRWEPVEVNRADHIRSVRLDSPGGDAELHAYIGGVASGPLDRHVPLWQLHLIDGLGDGGAVLLRSHHALGDGATLMHVLDVWAGPEPDPTASIDERRCSSGPTGGIEGAAAMLSKLLTFGSTAQVLGGEPGGTKSVAWTAPVPLEAVKELAKTTGSTVNDVCLALVAGALRTAVEGAAGAEHVEAIVPVNIRAPDEPIAHTMGNRFGLVFATLPTTLEGMGERIAAVKADMDRIKSTREARTVFGALSALGGTPKQGAQAWADAFARRASVVVTNIAGPRRRLRLGPSEATTMVLWVPSTGPVGVGVSICSYAGSLRFGVIADTAVMADPARFALALGQQLALAETDRRGPTRRAAS